MTGLSKVKRKTAERLTLEAKPTLNQMKLVWIWTHNTQNKLTWRSGEEKMWFGSKEYSFCWLTLQSVKSKLKQYDLFGVSATLFEEAEDEGDGFACLNRFHLMSGVWLMLQARLLYCLCSHGSYLRALTFPYCFSLLRYDWAFEGLFGQSHQTFLPYHITACL